MADSDIDPRTQRFERFLDERWKPITLLFWLATSAVLVFNKWNAIRWLALGDTDDNIRYDQVRDWLNGQGWYDLRQYRLNPPGGFSIHWSRLVDLPLAAMMVVLRPILGVWTADRIAVTVAPLLPMLLAFFAMAVVARRLVSRQSYALALAILVCAGTTLGMWTPLRIDHHGWQLAFLMVTVAALTDPDQRRSGIVIALSSALSLAIGLEMLPYIAFAGAAVALHWAWDRAEATRLRAYGLTMAVATGLCFLVFASNDNWHEVCDALSPVWMTSVVSASLLLVMLSWLKLDNAWGRLVAVLAAGAIAGGIYIGAFPQCFGHRLEGIPPEADALWLSHVREAKPIYQHPIDIAIETALLPIMGSIGALVAVWHLRGTRKGADWAPVALFGLFAGLLLLWQMRTGPSAQMMAVPGAAYLAHLLIRKFDGNRFLLVRVLGPVLAFLIVSGLIGAVAVELLPNRKARANNLAAVVKPAKPRPDLTGLANRRCVTIPAMAPLDRLSPAAMFSLIDLGPRLITLTHHDAVAGPYHRNWRAILDTEHAWRGTPEQAHAIIAAHHASYVLLCPHMAEATIYEAEAPGGFYAKLSQGFVPAWLVRQPLPANSPFVLYRVIG